MMNRLLLLLTTFLFAGWAAAQQTFEFQYQGVSLEDGATVTIPAQEDFFGELSCETNPAENPSNGLVLKMQGLSGGDVQAVLLIQNNGLGASMMQWCMGGVCSMAMNKTSLTKTFAPAGTVQVLFDATNIQGDGNLLATLTVTQNNQTRSVGILFTNEDATGISEIQNSKLPLRSRVPLATPSAFKIQNEGVVYDLAGRKVNSQFIIHNSQLGKGVFIVNGKKVLF